MDKNKSDEKNWLFLFVLVALAIFVFWLAWFWIVQYWYPALDNSGGVARPGPGVSGDMFGALTALFSGLAFAGLVVTLAMQREELDKQREELTQTRLNFERQRFEATLFNLIKLLDDYVSSIQLERRDLESRVAVEERFSGRKAFAFMAERIRPDAASRMYPPKDADEAANLALKRYDEVYRIYLVPYLGPYFRLFFNVIRHIRSADLSQQDKFEYAKYLRAYLSEGEILLLAMNGISQNGDEMRWPIKEFSMLRHMSHQDREVFGFLEQKYTARAFDEYDDLGRTNE